MKDAMDAVRVFPTRVGMNRWQREERDDETGIPHAGGDEPGESIAEFTDSAVFPTRVGMNR